METSPKFKQIELRLTRMQVTIDDSVDFQLCWRAWDWRTNRFQKKLSAPFKQSAPPATAVNWVFPAAADAAASEAFEGEVILLAMRDSSQKKVAGRCPINALPYLTAADAQFKQRFSLQRCPDRLAFLELEFRVSETTNAVNSFANVSSLGAFSMDSGSFTDSRSRSTAMGLRAAAIRAQSPSAARLNISAFNARRGEGSPARSSEPFAGKSSFAKLTTESENSASTQLKRQPKSLAKDAKKAGSRESIFSFKNSRRSLDEWAGGLDAQERLLAAESLVRSLRAEVERSHEQLRVAQGKEDEIATLRMRLLDSEETAQTFERENEQLRQNVERLQRESKILTITREEKTRIYEKKLREVETLQAHKSELARQNEALEDELGAACQAIKNNQREIDRLESELSASKKRVSAVMDLITYASQSKDFSKTDLIDELLSAISLNR